MFERRVSFMVIFLRFSIKRDHESIFRFLSILF